MSTEPLAELKSENAALRAMCASLFAHIALLDRSPTDKLNTMLGAANKLGKRTNIGDSHDRYANTVESVSKMAREMLGTVQHPTHWRLASIEGEVR